MVVMIMPTRDSDDELVLTMIANVPHAGDQVVGASESSKLEPIWEVGWWPMFRSTTNQPNLVLYFTVDISESRSDFSISTKFVTPKHLGFGWSTC